MDLIWMRHAVHGGRAQLPDDPMWRALGWEPSDPPGPEPDPTLVEFQPPPTAENSEPSEPDDPALTTEDSDG